MNDKCKYYNADYLHKILDYVEDRKYQKALQQFRYYLETYPNDFRASCHYANLLIMIGQFEEAKILLQRLERIDKNPYLTYLKILKLKIMCIEQKYMESVQLLNKNPNFFVDTSNFISRAFIFNRAGIKIKEYDYNDNYLFNQITNYSEEEFVKFIQKYLTNENNETFFLNEFPFEKVYEQIKTLLPTKNRIYNSIYRIDFIFKYLNCGIVDGKSTDYFQLVAFNDTYEPITMYPCKPVEYIGYTDLTPPKEEYSLNKSKRVSQIDKFNQRYGLNK